MTYKPTRLSQERFDSLKRITIEEYGDLATDEEIEEMGLRLMQIYSSLAQVSVDTESPQLNEKEIRALKFLKEEINSGRSPSVRDITKAMGYRSSRSGHRLLKQLIKMGLVKKTVLGLSV